METFEVTVKKESYRVSRNQSHDYSFSVFNHATCHVMKKNEYGLWVRVEHRFGKESLPLNEIGEAIDQHYKK
jgi:hypothetical protein